MFIGLFGVKRGREKRFVLVALLPLCCEKDILKDLITKERMRYEG
jgi:hypothetical protein